MRPDDAVPDRLAPTGAVGRSFAARRRTGWQAWTGALFCVALMCWVGLYGFAWSDYDTEVSGAFRALMHGDVAGFLGQSPAYGGSLVLRAPFAAATAALGGGELAVFRAVSIPCLLAAAALGVTLVRRMRERRSPLLHRMLVLGLCVANPIAYRALEVGHPEEILAAVLAIGAVLAASWQRPTLAAVLLGLAIASKGWAVLAVGPVLLALPSGRLRALVIAGGVTGAVLAPLALAGSGHSLVNGARVTGVIFSPWQIWWPLGEPGITHTGVDTLQQAGYRSPPAWLSALTHPLIAFLVVPLSLLWSRRHRLVPQAGGEQLLALLALLLLLRCMLDPWNFVYYELPCILALLAWEALCRRERPPVGALSVTALTWFTFMELPKWATPDVQFLAFVCWTLPLAAWLGREVYVPASQPRAHGRVRSSLPEQPTIGYS